MATIDLGYRPRPQFIPFHTRKQRWACIVAHRRFGKALDVATPIPMADGSWKTMGALVAGDVVLSEDGAPCNVVAAHPVQLNRPCYRVEFSDGAGIVCDEDHLWHTQTKLDRARHVGKREGPRGAAKYVSRFHSPRPGSVKTTAAIRDTLMYGRERNHSVALAGPAQYAARDLPIDPYIVGLWLGDGSSRQPHFTTMDDEIVAALSGYAEQIGAGFNRISSENCGRASTYSIAGARGRSLTTRLRALGLLQNKHIPEEYLRASVPQRVALLRGLMDTDGSIDTREGRDQCEITQKNERLARGIVRLLRSLGEMACMRPKIVNGTTYWRVNFRSSFNPFALRRKAELWSAPAGSRAFSRKRYIVAVEPVASRPVRCITVDSPSRLYLCGEHYVPTHNTVGCVMDLLDAALRCEKPNPRFAYVAPFYAQAKDIAWSYLKAFSAPIPGAVPNESELRVDLPNGGRVRLYGAENYDRLRGIYLDGTVLDEYGDCDPTVWTQVLRPALSDRKGWATFIGTPKGRNHFADIATIAAKSDDWFSLTLKASETGILDADELADARRLMSPEEYEQEYECSFAAAVKGAYYADEFKRVDAEKRICRVPVERTAPVMTAWDLGFTDETAIWFIQRVGYELRVVDYYHASGVDIAHYARVLKEKADERGWTYGDHYFPHDVAHKELISGRSRVEALRSLGIEPTYPPAAYSVDDGINAVRMLFDKFVFDEERTADGVAALRMYRRDYDQKTKTFRPRPLHDWTSHAADALRTFASQWPETPVARRRDAYSSKRTSGRAPSWIAA